MDSFWLILLLLIYCLAVCLCMDPEFDQPLVNVTVKEFSTAVLPCAVKFLGNHQVVWTDQFSTLLSYEDRRIIDDERLSVERPFTKDWNLHIRKVKHSDQGIYNCQINTIPVKVKTVNLKVDVPARIIHHLSTPDLVVKENEQVTLVCNVTGVPAPEVTWYRHVESVKKGVEKQKVGVNGEVLVIHNVTRYCGDIYECVAFNGVPPAVNHLIKVEVKFAPEIHLPNRRIGQDVGKETMLECTVSAYPHGVTVWKRHGKVLSNTPQRFRIENYEEDRNTFTVSLRIFSIESRDYGTYTCEARNAMGNDSESMILYEYSASLKTTSTTLSTTRRSTQTQQSTHSMLMPPPFAETHSPNSIFPSANRGHNSGSVSYTTNHVPWNSHQERQRRERDSQ